MKGRPVLPALLAALLLAAPAAAARCVPDPFPPGWLERQERAGGHAIERHVGRTDAQLVARLRAEPRIRAASSFPDLETAEEAVEAALAAHAEALNDWAEDAEAGARRVVDHAAGEAVGRIAERPAGLGNLREGRRVRAVVEATGGGGCRLVTAYPN